MAAKKKKAFTEMADDELTKEVDGLTKALFNLRVRKFEVGKFGHVADLVPGNLHAEAFLRACLYSVRMPES